MTSTPNEPRLYDVWLMWVEFPDHPGIGKPRPVVITEVDGDLVSGIVAKITGNTDWDEAGDVPLLDWKAEGLLKPSLVRCSQRFYFNRSELLQWFGRLSLRDAEHVNDGLEATLDIPPYRRSVYPLWFSWLHGLVLWGHSYRNHHLEPHHRAFYGAVFT